MMAIDRPLYSHQELSRLLAPRSVAIVGASVKPGAFSARTLENMANYRGDIYLINPRYDCIGEHPCLPSLRALPQAPDCVVIALPWDAAVQAVREAADAGAGGAIVYASGFAETGLADRTGLQCQMAAIARDSGMRVLGPNCLGVANNLLGAGLLFQMGYAQFEHPAGRVGLVSQSGALGYAMLQGARHGMAYTHMLTSGNSCDVDTLDLANYLVADPAVRSVACIFEAAGHARRLEALAAAARERRKPVIVYKTAVGESAGQAAQSHTGSMTGSAEAFEAAMRRAQFITARSLADLTEMADFFAKAPAPQAAGVAIMATSGGAAILCVDAASKHELPMPQPGEQAQRVLDVNVPEFGSARNPCDITGVVLNNPGGFEACAQAMLADPAYGALVLPQVTASQAIADQRCPMVSRLARSAGKPVCVVWLPEWLEGPGAATYARDENIGVFRDTQRCFRTLAAWRDWHAQADAQAASTRLVPNADGTQIREWLRTQPRLLTEQPAKDLIARYGLPVVPERQALSANEAARQASELGFPVVLKMDIPGVAHKTELGLVRVGLHNARAVRTAVRQMQDSARAKLPSACVGSFLVQPMIRDAFELMLGMKRDLVFGPLVTVGLGGVWVEVFKDIATELAPITLEQAHAMLRRLKVYRLLAGYRGKEGIDLDALARLVARFSEMCLDLDDVEEIDINPVMARGAQLVAVDALVARHA